MDNTTDISPVTNSVDDFDNVLERRHAFKSRHAESLTKLMEQRGDLRGVHALADLVDDAIRWTA